MRFAGHTAGTERPCGGRLGRNRQVCILSLGVILSSLASPAGELDLAQRISQREFPSVFQAWNAAAPRPGCTADDMLVRHDLAFLSTSALGLQDAGPYSGAATNFTADSLERARARRAGLQARNPHLVLLAEVRYRDAPARFLPDDSPWWKRDAQGRYVMGWAEGGYRLLDEANPGWQEMVAARARAVVDSGAFDGVMLDWWQDREDQVRLLQRVRAAIGDTALILVNANDRRIPRTAALVNGLFMECYRGETPADWQRIAETLRWAEANLRAPRINCLEIWYKTSRQDLDRMRAATALALTQSDGYCLFSDPNPLPTPDHLHDWYDFWDKGLGAPSGPGRQRADGAWERPFTAGLAIYNPPGQPRITITCSAPHRSRATGQSGLQHTLAGGDGDLLIRINNGTTP